jgi:TatD DNase family protein
VILVDIGVNLAHRRFAEDLDQVIARALGAGVTTMVVTGTSRAASQAAQALAARRPGTLWSTAGVHPHEAKTWSAETATALEALTKLPEVRAVGECGLDFDRNFSPPADQERAFEAQLALAAAVKLPVFLHERAAHARFLEIMTRHRASLAGGVVHCFTGGEAELDAYLALDLHIGITGWICDDRRGVGLRGLVGRIPRDRLLFETDAPFLTPRAVRAKRNEPAFLPHVLEACARAAGRAPEELAAETTRNARAFFRIA